MLFSASFSFYFQGEGKSRSQPLPASCHTFFLFFLILLVACQTQAQDLIECSTMKFLTIKDCSEKCFFLSSQKDSISLYISSKSTFFHPPGLHASILTPWLTQNAAAPLLLSLCKFLKINPLPSALHWHPVAARTQLKTLVLAHEATEGAAPPYLQIMIQPYSLALSFCFTVPPFSVVNCPPLCPVLTFQPCLGLHSSPPLECQ